MRECLEIETNYTTYHRRIKKLDPKILKVLIHLISKKLGIEKELGRKIVDGTGIGYKGKVEIKYILREEKIEINNHIKIVSVIKIVPDKGKDGE